MVDNNWPRRYLVRFHLGQNVRFSGSPQKAAGKSCAFIAEGISRNRQLDGGRNSLASSYRTNESFRSAERRRNKDFLEGSAFCRSGGFASDREGFRRSASRLAFSRALETAGNLSPAQNHFEEGHNRRPNYRVVSKMPKVKK